MKINFDSPYQIDDGYGNAGEHILLALDRHPEVEVFTSKNWKHTTSAKKGLEQRTIDLWARNFIINADFSIRFSQPCSFALTPRCKRKRIGWSMWEYTCLPDLWVSGSHQVPVVFVPCEHNKKMWKESGVRTPIYVIPLGVEQSIYYYRPDLDFSKPKAIADTEGNSIEYVNHYDGFTFVISGTVCIRKGHDMVYRVFRRLFSDKKDVRLIMKAPGFSRLRYAKWHNILKYHATWNKVRIADLLRGCDCFVYPTQGEGFGLSPVEAMAVGATAIVTDWSGPADYLNDAYSYKLDYKVTGERMVGKHGNQIFGHALPSEKHLEELMWHVYTHQDEARAKGRLAAKYVSENLTWDHTAQRLIDVLKTL